MSNYIKIMKNVKNIYDQLYRKIGLRLSETKLWDMGVFFALWAWVIYGYLSPKSPYNLSKYYKKKRPDILTFQVFCPTQIPQKFHRISIMEEHSFQSIFLDPGNLIRFPIFCFNDKVVSRSLAGRIIPQLLDMGLPINPSERAKLEIKTFHDDVSRSNWTIYVEPSEFSRVEYQQMLCCYEAHREEIDSKLKTSKVIPWWSPKSKYPKSFEFDYRAKRITRIVYGAMPQPQVFSPQKISTGCVVDGNRMQISNETLTVYPNGQWQIHIRRKLGKNPWNDYTMGQGKVTFVDPVLVFDVDSLHFYDVDIKDISVREYFDSFADSEGKKLTDFYQLGKIPSKFKPHVYGS
ncbi:hypothetical protein QT995_13595 [Microcoleus sp. S36b_A3]|uniref:hypothetical protein n=2 Tax=unclassified Microcoleus TaxID=2642155 RepID=UPI002FD0C190